MNPRGGGSREGRGSTRQAVVTDVGLVRANNEDAYLVAPPLFAVADGMGGHRAGEVASAGAMETLAAQAGRDTDSLVAAVQAANKAVYARAVASPDLAGMGTTVTAMMATRNSVQIVHVGDSRAYLLREGRLRRLTRDHTVVERLAREGKISPDEVDRHPQRSVLERALGVAPEVDVDAHLIDVHAGDRLLLCTDGLTSMLDDDEIRAVLLADRDPDAAAHHLVAEALEAGGKDNVTALIVDFPRRDGAGGADPNATAEQPPIVLDDPGAHAGVPPILPAPPRRLSGGAAPRAAVLPGSTPRAEAPHAPASAQAAPAKPDPNGSSHHVARHRVSHALARRGTPEDLPVPRGFRGRPPGTRLLIGGAIVLPLVVIAAVAGWAALNSSWYVGADGGLVAVFRGVPGSFGGVHLSSLQSKTDVPVASLPVTYAAQVRAGMTAKSHADAVQITRNLKSLEIPTAVTATVTPATPTGTATVAPRASP